MGGRVVEGTGLENRQGRKSFVGSNPTPSARNVFSNLVSTPLASTRTHDAAVRRRARGFRNITEASRKKEICCCTTSSRGIWRASMTSSGRFRSSGSSTSSFHSCSSSCVERIPLRSMLWQLYSHSAASNGQTSVAAATWSSTSPFGSMSLLPECAPRPSPNVIPCGGRWRRSRLCSA